MLAGGADVTARWKREDRIVDKLVRLPTLRLPQMQDVGGCRVVLRSPQTELGELADAIRARWTALADDDYVARPRETGYRARHLVLQHEGVAIEVQLRTFLQDAWAEAFETVQRTTDLAAHGSHVRTELADFFRDLSRVLARSEGGTIPRDAAMHDLLGLFAAYRRTLQVLHWTAPPDPPPS